MMQRKIMISYLIMILLGTLITGVFSYHIAQKSYISEVENKLLTIGNIVKDEVVSQEVAYSQTSLNQTALKYGTITDIRITFIDKKGKVLGDSVADYTTLENHGDRPEIIQAFETGYGEVTRYSTSTNQYLKYVAIRIHKSPHTIVVRLSIPIRDIRIIREQLILFIIAGIIVAILASGILGIQFATKITRPVRQLTSFAKDIAKGNLKGAIEVEANHEIGELTKSFVNMRTRLDETITQLLEKNMEMKSILDSMIGGLIALDQQNRIILINNTAIQMFGIKNKKIIGENILFAVRNHLFNQFIREYKDTLVLDKQKVLDIQYEDKYYKLYLSKIEGPFASNKTIGKLIIIEDVTNIKKLEQIRSDFVSNVTHELKTPLTSIKGFIDTLKGGAIHDEEVAEHFLDIIDIEAERLSILIGDILQLSEIESMKQDIRIEEYELEGIILEVLNIIRPNAEQKSINISYCIEQEGLKVNVNKDRLKQMLINLIDNGIKYNDRGGAVRIICKKKRHAIEFTISDNGIGIAQEHISRLFERFYRVDKGRSRNLGGTGLGLSIVKHIVNLYGGQIQVNSMVGEGTTFTINLPIATTD